MLREGLETAAFARAANLHIGSCLFVRSNRSDSIPTRQSIRHRNAHSAGCVESLSPQRVLPRLRGGASAFASGRRAFHCRRGGKWVRSARDRSSTLVSGG